MTEDEALDIGADFQKYLGDASNKGLINKYSLPQLKQAKQLLHRRHNGKPWYDELLKQIGTLEKVDEEKILNKWWDKPLFVGLASAIIGAIVMGIISWWIALAVFNKQKSDINEIQVILADKNKEITTLREENKALKKELSETSVQESHQSSSFRFGYQ